MATLRWMGVPEAEVRLVEGTYEKTTARAAPHRTSPHLTSPHLTSPHLTSPHLTSPHHTTPHHTTPHHTTPQHITSHHTTPHHTTPQHSTSHHITSHHITSYYRRDRRLLVSLPKRPTSLYIYIYHIFAKSRKTSHGNVWVGHLKGHCIEFKYYADGIHSGLTYPAWLTIADPPG